LKLRLLAALLALIASTSQAATVITPGDTWQYRFAAPAAGWQVGADAGSWNTGLAPFSNCGPIGGQNCSGYDPAGHFNAGTQWNADGSDGNDLWVRKSVDLAGFDLDSFNWSLGVDNGFSLFINGTLVASANAEGFTSRWEYNGAVSPALLNAGNNWIAVALEDHGGLTAFDMQLTGNAVAVPEPETYALMLAGLGVVGFVARRRRAD
jgi:opacity protein-like surface antigen